ncbi:MAG: hypothetical protein HRU40_02305 [Saprospiraceae bacterium]|nr:hypothetical protein [Saprospiraceae bacterium]
MRSKKNFTMGKGKYYFTIKSTPNNITMFRQSKQAAVDTYMRYRRLGKEVEWLGKWDGKKFTESSVPSTSV